MALPTVAAALAHTAKPWTSVRRETETVGSRCSTGSRPSRVIASSHYVHRPLIRPGNFKVIPGRARLRELLWISAQRGRLAMEDGFTSSGAGLSAESRTAPAALNGRGEHVIARSEAT